MAKNVLVIDNYDSFTFNLVQALCILGAEVKTLRNDELSVSEYLSLSSSHIVISPGPGRPEEAGESVALVKAALGRVPLLGVCLGHQALAQALGGRITRAARPMHGKASRIYHDGQTIFRHLPNPFEAGRYHSLAVLEEDLPSELEITAFTPEGEIMGLRHPTLRAEGVQFHPESLLTPEGISLLSNFLDLKV